MALSTLSGSSIIMLLMLFVAAAAQRSDKYIVMPTNANSEKIKTHANTDTHEKIKMYGKGDCTIEIRIATGKHGTDGKVGARVYDGQSSSFLDFPELDNPGNDFEAFTIDTFTLKNKPCFKKVCAAGIMYSSNQPWSFESVGVKVKDSNGAVVSEMFGVYGKRLSAAGSQFTNFDSAAVVGSCA